VEDFDERRLQFEMQQENQRTGTQLDKLKEVQTILENMAPAEAKKQLLIKLDNKELVDVVSIIRGMPSDEQKKVLAEFTLPEDHQKLADVLPEIRRGQPQTAAEPDPKKP